VFTAEATALAFASLLLHFMQMDQINYFTDNQLLAHYLNNVDRFDIPDWRAAPYTHIINPPWQVLQRCSTYLEHTMVLLIL
jgi:hypothetical protein